MKRVLFFVVLFFFAMAAHAQKYTFSKGNVAPGAIKSAAAYEDFIGGSIRVSDNAGDYTFVSAQFTLASKSSKPISFTITSDRFPENEIGNIARASSAGAIYTFTKIIVKDQAGKQIELPEVRFEFGGFR